MTILMSGVTSLVVASAVLYSKANDYVEEAYNAEAVKFRLEFITSCDEDGRPVDIPKTFSKDETFKPAKIEKSVLEQKIGFEFRADNLVCGKIEGLWDRCVGQEYVFSVETATIGDTQENLTIYNYSGQIAISSYISSYISLHDYDHNGLLDWISISDKENNTSIHITRGRNGELEYDNINEDGAKQLYDLYTSKFNAFKTQYGIDKKILDYEPKMEIKEITLEKTEK